VDLLATIEQARDAITVRRVYGDPYEHDGVTLIPAALVRGGIRVRGGNEDRTPGRGGFGLAARPVGAFVIRNGEVSWKPVVDATRIALRGQLVAIAALLVLGSILRRR
jgi:uncharacterized spore protein YtfJ